MSRDLVVCRPEDDVEHALRCRSEHQVRRIPIVDQAGKLTAPKRWKKATAAVGIGLLTRGIANRELMSWADVGNPRKSD